VITPMYVNIFTHMQGALEIHHSNSFKQCNVGSNTLNKKK
jgi:hypothetical protein